MGNTSAPTAFLRSHVTTFSYGGFGQIEKMEEVLKRAIPVERFRRMTAADSVVPDLYKNDPDPFAIPEVESYPVEDQKHSPPSAANYINQQDPRVQEVDVVGWFE